MSSVAPRPPTIAVIMPAYNEAARIDPTIGTIARYRAGSGANVRAVFVADDDPVMTRSPWLARQPSARAQPSRCCRSPHRGKALTVRSAMLEVAERSDTDYLMMLDADDELRIDQLDRVVWSRIREPCTSVAGTTDRSGDRPSRPSIGDSCRSRCARRRVSSSACRIAIRSAVSSSSRGTLCRTCSLSSARPAGPSTRGILFIAHRVSHLPIVEVPVVWTPRGVSRVRPLAAALSGLALFGTAWNRLRGAYQPVGVLAADQRPAIVEVLTRDLAVGARRCNKGIRNRSQATRKLRPRLARIRDPRLSNQRIGTIAIR